MGLADFFLATDEEIAAAFRGWKRAAPLLEEFVVKTVTNPFTGASKTIRSLVREEQPEPDTNAVVDGDFRRLDLPALLDRIESEMGNAASEVQWTMNFCLAGIGIHFPKHRKRAIAIGEKMGLYRDYPVSKGCTSPFAPIWINEMVRRHS